MRLLFLGLLLLIVNVGANAVTLIFSADVSIHGNQILLSDIATIDGTDQEKAKFQNIVIGVAPVIGSSCDLNYGTIRMRLRQNDINLDAVTFAGATSIKVKRTSTAIDGATLASIGQTWLQGQIAANDGDEIVLTPIRVPNDLTLPEGKITWQCSSVGNEKSASRYVLVDVFVDAKSAWHGMIGYKVERFAMVLVAKRQLSRGVVLDETMLSLERRDIAALASSPIRSVDSIKNNRLASAVSVGSILTTEKVEVIPVVKRNDIVQVRAMDGALTITLLAVACEDGAIGDTIRVQNQQSRREFTARVVGAGDLVLDL